MRDDALLFPWFDRARDEVPGVSLFDAHTHIGSNDPDGYRCSPEELIEALELADARGVVFPMHEPSGYRDANDRVIAAAEASGGRLTAFCRLDPRDGAAAEAERALAAGARGIKLHPRAEDFTLDMPEVSDVFALAHERRVPILTHAGRGIPALGRHAVQLCERFPDARLILAHAGICDLAWVWRAAREVPNLFFDTAWWAPSDLLALMALVPPGQILLASDAPYGTPALRAAMDIRYALQLGLSQDQVRGIAGEQLERIIAGEDTPDLGPAPGPERLSADPVLDRIHTFLVSSVGQMFAGVEPTEALSLAELACEVGDDVPQAQVCRSILALLKERDDHVPRSQNPGRFAPGLHLVILAAALSRTPDVPLPHDPVAVDVTERMH